MLIYDRFCCCYTLYCRTACCTACYTYMLYCLHCLHARACYTACYTSRLCRGPVTSSHSFRNLLMDLPRLRPISKT